MLTQAERCALHVACGDTKCKPLWSSFSHCSGGTWRWPTRAREGRTWLLRQHPAASWAQYCCPLCPPPQLAGALQADGLPSATPCFPPAAAQPSKEASVYRSSCRSRATPTPTPFDEVLRRVDAEGAISVFANAAPREVPQNYRRALASFYQYLQQ